MIFRNRISILTLLAFILAGNMLYGCNESGPQRITQQETKPSLEQNFLTLQNKAAQGDANAQDALGVLYYKRDGVPEDAVQGVAWHQPPASD